MVNNFNKKGDFAKLLWDVLDNNICKVHTKRDGILLVSFFTIMDFVFAVLYMAPSLYQFYSTVKNFVKLSTKMENMGEQNLCYCYIWCITAPKVFPKILYEHFYYLKVKI